MQPRSCRGVAATFAFLANLLPDIEAMTDSPDTSTVIKALVDDDLESLSTDQLRKRLDALGEKRGTLAEKKSNLVSHLSEVKGGEHTQESFEELNETKSKIQEVESDLSELKTAQKRVKRLYHQRRQNTTKAEANEEAQKQIRQQESYIGELKGRIEKLSDEVAEKDIELKSTRSRLASQTSVRDSLRNLISELQPLMRVARDTEERDNKNLISSTTATLWLDDLWDIRDVASDAADALDR